MRTEITTHIGGRLRGLKQEKGGLLNDAENLSKSRKPEDIAEADSKLARVRGINAEIRELEELIEQDRSTLAAGAGAIEILPRLKQSACGPEGRRFRDLFPHAGRSAHPWKSTEEFLATIHSGLADPRLQIVPGFNATATIGSPSGGGFSVPELIWAEWLDASLETEIVRPRSEVRPMKSDSGRAIGWDDGDHSAGLYGGFSGDWVPEAGEITPQDPKLRMINLLAKKLAILTQVSNELVADGISFEEQLSAALVKAIGWFFDRTFLITGTGSGQPLSILNAPATIVQTKEGGQTATTIVLQNITKMFSRLSPDSFANAVWIAHPTTIPQLLTTSLVVSSGGSFYPLLQGDPGNQTIFTRPVIFSEKLNTLGAKGDIMLCDLSQYIIGLRSEAALDKSQHVGFTRDTSYYRCLSRLDGQPKIAAPLKMPSTDTVSPFVTLEAR
jgi:HK97 family phage major capsid protein